MFRIRTALATALVAAAATLAVAAPASAHDELVSSTPAADSTLTEAPTEVTLTFSNELLSLEQNSGTAMTVVDASGDDWADGDPAVTGDTVNVPLADGMPDGAYTVTWKVVSSDGHPTSGEYTFSVAAGQASASPTPTPMAAPSSSPTAAPVADSSTPWPLLIGIGAVVLVAIVVIVVVARRRR